MNQPLLSIIVPCYNAEQFLRETIDCLIAQTLSNWECIIVNDGSTDNSLDIIKEYAEKDSRYKYLDKKNEGPAVARNVAINMSKGKYILPLDADDLISPDYAATAIDYLEKHQKTKLVYCEADFFGEKTGHWILPDYHYEDLLWSNMIFCSAVYRRSDFNKTLGYNPNMRHGIEDWDFWLSLLTKDDEVYKIPKTMFFYRKHDDSRSAEYSDYLDETVGQMVMNHLDIYRPHLGRMFNAEAHVKYLQGEIDKILHSKKYKVGMFVLHPLQSLKNIFFKR